MNSVSSIFVVFSGLVTITLLSAKTLSMMHNPDRWLLRTQGRKCKRRARNERSGRFLTAIAVRLLEPSQQARYLEEFHAELLELERGRRRHALGQLRATVVIRVRRGLKNENEASDAVARRARG